MTVLRAAGSLSAIAAILVPVDRLEIARYWYARLFDLPEVPDIEGHLALIPTNSPSLVLALDSTSPEVPELRGREPLIPLETDDIDLARDWVTGLGCRIILEEESGSWFDFRTPDGNRFSVQGAAGAGAGEHPEDGRWDGSPNGQIAYSN